MSERSPMGRGTFAESTMPPSDGYGPAISSYCHWPGLPWSSKNSRASRYVLNDAAGSR